MVSVVGRTVGGGLRKIPLSTPVDPVPEQALTVAKSRALLARNWGGVQNSLLAYISASAPQFSDAEDILQEVAVEVAVRFDEYDPTRPFLPWALWIAKFKIAEFYRRRERRQVILVGDAADGLAEACIEVHERLSDEQIAIEQCLGRLTDRSRELLNLRYAEGMSSSEIGTRLGMSVRYVRVALSRIRTMLTECAQATVSKQSPLNA
ncbi:MAG: RNA polymerase subunit sigma-70 [Planctomyces sp.]|nr:RNA polymerase subunit sigma-70 [Planctomyces sp.]